MVTAYEAFEYYSQLEERCAELEKKALTLTDVSRFSDVAISTSEAARFLGIDRQTALDYAKRGLLKRHPTSRDAKIMLVASDVLTKTAEELRRAKRRMKWNLKDE